MKNKKEINTPKNLIVKKARYVHHSPSSEEVKIQNKNKKEWLPSSLNSIKNTSLFDSSTFYSEIPSQILNNSSDNLVLGIDEAGRGPVLGPMVYALAYCIEGFQDSLKNKHGFMDSKMLKKDERQALAMEIERNDSTLNLNVGWATYIIASKDILASMLLSEQGKKNHNLNDQAHNATIHLIKEVLKKKINLKKIFVDTVGSPQKYQKKLQSLFDPIEIVVAKKADSLYPIVSSASVIAKVTRDSYMSFVNKKLNLLSFQNIGSGYPSDPITSKWLAVSLDPLFGWHYGLVRFLWLSAKSILSNSNSISINFGHTFKKNQMLNLKAFKVETLLDVFQKSFYCKDVFVF